ncbi:hypothetical protein [Micromonospora zhanjiangensis]
MNRRRTGLAAGTVLLALIAGCGIPDGTEVQVDGPVATPLSGRSGASGAELPTRLSTVDPGQFVVNYLKQAAGRPAAPTSGPAVSSPRRTGSCCGCGRATRSPSTSSGSPRPCRWRCPTW